jgi:hypothetical protein
MLDDIAKIKQREQLAAWETNERKLAATLPPAARAELSSDCHDRLAVFVSYCKSQNVRHCPARPATCAAFAAAEAANGRDARGVISLLTAIGELHDHHGFSNPVATATVSAVLDRVVKTEPPRSWAAAEKSDWARLPPTIRETITRREKERDVALKRKFNELAELKKRYAATDEAALTPKENGNDQSTNGQRQELA